MLNSTAKEGWGCSSVVQSLPSMHEALDLIYSSNKKASKQQQNRIAKEA
jgi:hypothetical protein